VPEAFTDFHGDGFPSVFMLLRLNDTGKNIPQALPFVKFELTKRAG